MTLNGCSAPSSHYFTCQCSGNVLSQRKRASLRITLGMSHPPESRRRIAPRRKDASPVYLLNGEKTTSKHLSIFVNSLEVRRMPAACPVQPRRLLHHIWLGDHPRRGRQAIDLRRYIMLPLRSHRYLLPGGI